MTMMKILECNYNLIKLFLFVCNYKKLIKTMFITGIDLPKGNVKQIDDIQLKIYPSQIWSTLNYFCRDVKKQLTSCY